MVLIKYFRIMKSIFSMIKNIYISLLLIVTAIFIGCSDDDGEKIPYKGATTQLMQGIVDNVSYIQQIQKEEIIKISDGVSVIDVSFCILYETDADAYC